MPLSRTRVRVVRQIFWLSIIPLLSSCGQSAPATIGSTAVINPATVVLASIVGTDPGGSASATVSAPPNTGCTIAYTTPDGRRAHLPNLNPRTTDARGRATWTWYIATNTPRGVGMVAVTCGGVTRSARILIGVGE